MHALTLCLLTAAALFCIGVAAIITRRNAVGNAIADQNATTFAAKDGSNLVLSLDVNVQEIAHHLCQIESTKQHPRAQNP